MPYCKSREDHELVSKSFTHKFIVYILYLLKANHTEDCRENITEFRKISDKKLMKKLVILIVQYS